MKLTAAAIAATALILSVAAHASPITLEFTGTGADLTLGSAVYNDVNFSVEMVADTSAIDTTTPGIPTYDSLTATMTISGGPTVTIPVYVFNNQDTQAVGFGTLVNYDLFDLADQGVGLNTYGLTTAFGPISTSNIEALDQWTNVSTSGGNMSVSSVALGTFQAVTSSSVPEPGTLGLLGLGLAALVLASRKRPACA